MYCFTRLKDRTGFKNLKRLRDDDHAHFVMVYLARDCHTKWSGLEQLAVTHLPISLLKL